jgi:hypothetical protein
LRFGENDPHVELLEGDNPTGRLVLRIYGNPNALLFKDRLYSELRAEVCGECGHTELRVVNPREFYEKYQECQSRK